MRVNRCTGKTAVMVAMATVMFLCTETVCRASPCTGGGCGGTQGTTIHGTGLFENVNIPLLSSSLQGCGNLSVDKGVLVAKDFLVLNKCRDPGAFKNVTFKGVLKGRIITFRIERVQKHGVNWFGGEFKPPDYYYLVRWSYGVERERPLCPIKLIETGRVHTLYGLEFDNREIRDNAPALVVPGAWSSSGNYIASEQHFTFACLPEKSVVQNRTTYIGGGAAAKCIEWGLPPWNEEPVDSSRDSKNLHATCVHMAMADYCGEGKSNTVEGTPIHFYDVPGMLGDKLSKPDSSYALEAAWGIDNCGQVKTVCLSKARWGSLPIDGTCQSIRHLLTPRDPLRTVINLRTGRAWDALDCFGKTPAELKSQGALLLSYSRRIDVGLYRFRLKSSVPGAERFLTTTSVESNVSSSTSYALNRTYSIKKEGPESSTIPEDYELVSFEGPIYSLDSKATETVPVRYPLVTLSRCKTLSGEPVTVLQPKELLPLLTPRMSETERGSNRPAISRAAFSPFVECKEIGKIHSKENPPNPITRPFFRGLYRPQEGPDRLLINPLYLWKYTEGGVVHYATATDQPSRKYLERDRVLLGYMPPLERIE